VIAPVAELMVPTDVLLLLHVPPPVEFVNVVEEASQTDAVPPMVFGSGFTVTIVVLKHPEVIK
jgi:hypothetical protein